jgi:hypothetical protein
LRYAQSLLGHALPSGDVAEVLDRALDALIQRLEQQKFAATARVHPAPASAGVPRGAANGRYVPAEVRRAVWQRDGGQCTFVSEAGSRCEARTRLEFDHVDPVARGGETSVTGMRLRCRAHNQYTAECTFGAGFMRERRREARRVAEWAKTDARAKVDARAKEKAQADARAKAEAATRAQAAAERARELDVTPWLRQLGLSVAEARRGTALCAHIPDASIEERVRVAVRGLAPTGARRTAQAANVKP